MTTRLHALDMSSSTSRSHASSLLAPRLSTPAVMSPASLLTGPPPAAAFWVVAGVLALLDGVAAMGAWLTADPGPACDPAGAGPDRAGFGVAAVWIGDSGDSAGSAAAH